MITVLPPRQDISARLLGSRASEYATIAADAMEMRISQHQKHGHHSHPKLKTDNHDGAIPAPVITSRNAETKLGASV